MHPGVISSPPGASVQQLAMTMLLHGIHAVVLGPPDQAEPLMVTDLRLLRTALKRPDARAQEIAAEPLASLPTDATLRQAVQVMAERYVAHVLATEPESGAPAGIVSTFDVAAVLAGHDPRYARLLRPAPARPLVSAATLAQARAGEVMHAGITTCGADVPLQGVVRAMAEHRVHSVAVAGIDRHAHLTWGLITDLGLILALHRGALEEQAGSIAATEPIAVQQHDTVDRVASMMVEHDTTHLVVVDRAGLPAGIISSLDVVELLAGSGV